MHVGTWDVSWKQPLTPPQKNAVLRHALLSCCPVNNVEPVKNSKCASDCKKRCRGYLGHPIYADSSHRRPHLRLARCHRPRLYGLVETASGLTGVDWDLVLIAVGAHAAAASAAALAVVAGAPGLGGGPGRSSGSTIASATAVEEGVRMELLSQAHNVRVRDARGGCGARVGCCEARAACLFPPPLQTIWVGPK